MARPRKYKRPQIRRKCHHCGKMTNLPYIVSKVPSVGILDIVPYSKKGTKMSRAELRGDRKVEVKKQAKIHRLEIKAGIVTI